MNWTIDYAEKGALPQFFISWIYFFHNRHCVHFLRGYFEFDKTATAETSCQLKNITLMCLYAF